MDDERRGGGGWSWPFGRRSGADAPPDGAEEALLERIQVLEQRLEQVSARADRLAAILLRLVKLLVPPLVVGLLLLFTWILWPDRFDQALTRVVGGILVGKIAAAGLQGDFLYWLVMMGTLDVMIGLFFLWNVDAIYRLRWVGDRFREMEELGWSFLQQADWLRRMAFIGVTMFIAIPVHGTGSITGSILGRFLGLGTWRTLLALVIAGYGGVAVVLSGSKVAERLREIDPILMGVFLTLVALGLLAFWWRFIHRAQRGQRERRAEDVGKRL